MEDDSTTYYIVDYDISTLESKRRAFYRRLRRYIEDNPGVTTLNYSTKSVVITDNEEFAMFVYNLASKIGRAHMYVAKKVM